MKLPKGWKLHELGHFIRGLEAGVSVNGDDEPAQGEQPGVLKVSAVSNGRFLPQNNKRIVANEISRARVKPKAGSIIISRSNTALLVADSAYVSHDIEHCFLSDKLWQTIFDEASPCSAQWLAAVLQTKRVRTQLIRLATGTSGSMKNISKEAFLALEVPSPPLAEQRKIADILTTWDEALTQLDALIKAQERRKKALMQQLLIGKKRFPAFAKKPWKKVRMGEVLKRVFRPIDWSAEMSLSLVSLRRRCGGLFRRPDVLGADYKTQDLHELHADDFLISKRQVAHGAWGLVTPEFAGSHVSKEYAILVNTAPEKLHMPFFAWLSQTPRMIRLSRVASTGVHIEKLIFDPVVFLRDAIRIPSDLEEQRQIAALLDTADLQLTLLRTQRTALDQQKRGLMQHLLTGKLRVKVAEGEMRLKGGAR